MFHTSVNPSRRSNWTVTRETNPIEVDVVVLGRTT